MFRTIAVALGLAVAASAVAAEEFIVHINDVGQEAGATSVAAPVVGDNVVDGTAATADLPEATQRAILNARGELPTYFGVNPFN